MGGGCYGARPHTGHHGAHPATTTATPPSKGKPFSAWRSRPSWKSRDTLDGPFSTPLATATALVTLLSPSRSHFTDRRTPRLSLSLLFGDLARDEEDEESAKAKRERQNRAQSGSPAPLHRPPRQNAAGSLPRLASAGSQAASAVLSPPTPSDHEPPELRPRRAHQAAEQRSSPHPDFSHRHPSPLLLPPASFPPSRLFTCLPHPLASPLCAPFGLPGTTSRPPPDHAPDTMDDAARIRAICLGGRSRRPLPPRPSRQRAGLRRAAVAEDVRQLHIRRAAEPEHALRPRLRQR
ncbi:hypothetical protein BDY21DRAFT_353430 [Lineolata rhizophorae]|uniref:Uncharacterized protein n=1 Tax=Lineolata rhizophorae TaxID=578093 RepID=A0A6A6NR05_9PEZI|nr:hypothetical protein BDY21DRAFT_353430 [Lineolata rhizophorae]